MSAASWYAPVAVVLFPLVLTWVALIGLSIAADWMGRDQFAVTATDDRWVDVGDDAATFRARTRRVRTGRVIRLAGALLLIWAAYLTVHTFSTQRALWLGLLVWLIIAKAGPYMTLLVAGIGLAVAPGTDERGVIMALAVSAWFCVVGRRWVKRKYPSYRLGTDAATLDDWLVSPTLRWNRQRVGALALSSLIALAFSLILYTYGSAKLVQLMTTSGVDVHHSAVDALPLGGVHMWSVLVEGLSVSGFGVAEILLIGSVAGLFAANNLALQLWSPEIWEVVDEPTPRAFVYLRNFDDDKVLIRAGSYTRVPLLQVIFDVLVPIRRRPFEQVMAGLLKRFGPVIGAADPRSQLRRPGALKAPLSHDSWRDQVKDWCESAIAVVVSATPTAVNAGLQEELRILSEELSHERVILVLGPGTRAEVLSRFERFKAALPADSKFLDDLNDARVAAGTLVMVRVPGSGWDCWGATHRTEAAYAVALDQALAYAEEVWGNSSKLRPANDVVGVESALRPSASETVENPRRTRACFPMPDLSVPGIEVVSGPVESPWEVAALGMRCGMEGLPEPLGNVKILGWWTGTAEFHGLPAGRQHIALAVSSHRVYGIISHSGTDDELWLSVPRLSVSVRTEGSIGRYRKRPERLHATGDGWIVEMCDVSRYFANLNAFQDGQEGSLLKALTAPVPEEPEPQPPDRLSPPGGNWTPVRSTGLHMHILPNGSPGSTLALADPRERPDSQAAHVRGISWLPENIRERESRRLADGVDLRYESLDIGEYHSPFAYPVFAVTSPGHCSTPLSRYLWPALDTNLQPSLDGRERGITQWHTECPRGYWVVHDLQPDWPESRIVPEDIAHNVDWYLTNRRIILVTRGRSRSSAGALHVRFEWISAVNIERYDFRSARPGTLDLNVVSGGPNDSGFALWINPGMASSPESEALAGSVLAALSECGLNIRDPRRRVSDNGKEGLLTWDSYSVDGPGLRIYQPLLS